MKEQLIIKPRKGATGDFSCEYGNGEVAIFGYEGVWSYLRHSTAIRQWEWRYDTLEFRVMYLSSDKEYRYEGVPMVAVWNLLMADSVGSFIATKIKPHYSVA